MQGKEASGVTLDIKEGKFLENRVFFQDPALFRLHFVFVSFFTVSCIVVYEMFHLCWNYKR